jgi:hypothetical protein
MSSEKQQRPSQNYTMKQQENSQIRTTYAHINTRSSEKRHQPSQNYPTTATVRHLKNNNSQVRIAQ